MSSVLFGMHELTLSHLKSGPVADKRSCTHKAGTPQAREAYTPDSKQKYNLTKARITNNQIQGNQIQI